MAVIVSEKSASLKGNGGFTLLELLISITLIAGIAVIAAGAMRLGSKSVLTSEKRVDALERYRTSLAIVDSQIQSQVPLTIDDSGFKKYQFKGDRRSLHFTTNYSIWGGKRGYAEVTYRVTQGEQGKAALHATENTVGVENGKEVRLFDNCLDIGFDYFFRGVEEEGRWVDQWTDENNVPEKVRITLSFSGRKTVLIIPVRVAGQLRTTMPGGVDAAVSKEKT